MSLSSNMFDWLRGNKWKRYLTVDTILYIVMFVVVLYFIYSDWRDKRADFKFQGFNMKDPEDVIPRESVQPEIERSDVHISHDGYSFGHPRPTKKPKFNKSEEKCRVIFEGIFNKKFKSIRPEWLKNPVTGKNLELDGYNPDIKTPLGYGLAFEYNGSQHSKYTPHFHRNGSNEFVYQVKKDSFKNEVCKKKGILVINIPHVIHYDELEKFIISKLKEKGVKF